MIPLNLDNVKQHLHSKGIESEIQKETDQLCIVLKIGDRDFPLFIRIYEGNELLQLLAFLPCNTKESALGDTARLLHLLNKEIDTPGFGMDETSSVVFFRTMLPVKDKKIDPQLFDAYLNATQVVCQSFAPVIAAVAYGGITFDEVLKKSKEHGGPSVSQTKTNRK